MTDTEAEVLKLVSEHNGQWSWYQLDRALSMRAPKGKGTLGEVLKKLEHRGFVLSRLGNDSSQPVYCITRSGQRLLEELHNVPA